MLVPFEDMPGTARIWIYPSDRKLTEAEVPYLKKQIEQFLTTWMAHGIDLKASYRVAYRRFVVLVLDESHHRASGCSIDASVNLIRTLETRLNVRLLNNDKVAFLIDEEVQLFPFKTMKEKIEDRVIDAKTRVFDNTITCLADLEENWLVESRESWVKRYFNRQPIS